MTIGMAASTRGSTAPCTRWSSRACEPPATTNFSIAQLAALLAGQELLDAVHRPDGAFDHRQAGRPGFVAGLQVLVPGVGDQVVFRSRLLPSPWKTSGWLGTILSSATTELVALAMASVRAFGRLGRFAAVGAADDEEQGLVRRSLSPA